MALVSEKLASDATFTTKKIHFRDDTCLSQ